MAKYKLIEVNDAPLFSNDREMHTINVQLNIIIWQLRQNCRSCFCKFFMREHPALPSNATIHNAHHTCTVLDINIYVRIDHAFSEL